VERVLRRLAVVTENREAKGKDKNRYQ